MNEQEHLETKPLDAPGRGSGALGREGEEGCLAGTKACRCGRCRLYRSYPPLLAASTLMAGVFCVLYLTKPVRFSAPAGGGIPVVAPAAPSAGLLVEAAAVGGAVPDPDDGRGLDPMLGGLPGDQPDGPPDMDGFRLATRGPAPATPVGNDFKPLVVDGPREGLFVPGRPVGPAGETGGPEPEAELQPVAAVPSAVVPREAEASRQPELIERAAPRPVGLLGAVAAVPGEPFPLLVSDGTVEDGDRIEDIILPPVNESGGEAAPVPPSSIIAEFYSGPGQSGRRASSLLREESI